MRTKFVVTVLILVASGCTSFSSGEQSSSRLETTEEPPFTVEPNSSKDLAFYALNGENSPQSFQIRVKTIEQGVLDVGNQGLETRNLNLGSSGPGLETQERSIQVFNNVEPGIKHADRINGRLNASLYRTERGELEFVESDVILITGS